MARIRLTITLEREILRELDKIIDGAEIRNRSHAIEYILGKSLLPKITQVLILAGGQGLKMRPFTYEMPKSMIPLKGRPLLEYTLELLRKFEFRDIIVCVGHLGEKIEEYFADGHKFGVKIKYSEGKSGKEGTALPLKDAKKLLGDSPFLLFYGDVLADIDLGDLVEFHNSHKKLATMALTTVADISGWGVVELTGNRISSFSEKPQRQKARSHLINAGIYVFHPQIFDYITDEATHLEKDVFPKLARLGELYGYHFSGKWFDVGSPESYERALKEWRE